MSLPTISPAGTPQEGEPLTGTQGQWHGRNGSADDPRTNGRAVAAEAAPVGTANSPSYTLTPADVGHTIVVAETATDAPLVRPSTAVDSVATAAVAAAAAPAPPHLPPIGLGRAPSRARPSTLVPGVWTNAHDRITDQLVGCTGGVCAAIPRRRPARRTTVGLGRRRATRSTFVESASNDGAATPATTGDTRRRRGGCCRCRRSTRCRPTIAGTAQQGQVLTVTPGTWLNSPTSITEQWEDCTALVCTAIPGQTGTSYTVGPGDVGHTIEVVETAVNAAAPSGVAAASARTATASATSATSVVAFSQNTPTTNQGVTLVATVSLELFQRQSPRLAVVLQWLGRGPGLRQQGGQRGSRPSRSSARPRSRRASPRFRLHIWPIRRRSWPARAVTPLRSASARAQPRSRLP